MSEIRYITVTPRKCENLFCISFESVYRWSLYVWTLHWNIQKSRLNAGNNVLKTGSRNGPWLIEKYYHSRSVLICKIDLIVENCYGIIFYSPTLINIHFQSIYFYQWPYVNMYFSYYDIRKPRFVWSHRLFQVKIWINGNLTLDYDSIHYGLISFNG